MKLAHFKSNIAGVGVQYGVSYSLRYGGINVLQHMQGRMMNDSNCSQSGPQTRHVTCPAGHTRATCFLHHAHHTSMRHAAGRLGRHILITPVCIDLRRRYAAGMFSGQGCYICSQATTFGAECAPYQCVVVPAAALLQSTGFR